MPSNISKAINAGHSMAISYKSVLIHAIFFITSEIALYYLGKYMLEHISPIIGRGLFVLSLCVWVGYFGWKISEWVMNRRPQAKLWCKPRTIQLGFSILAVIVIASTSPLYVSNVIPNKVTMGTSTLPTFIDASQEVIFSLGGGGAHYVYRWNDFQNKVAAPFEQEGITFYAYVYNGKICVDASLYGNKDNPLVQITHNELLSYPSDWDRNYDQHAFEVVNEKQEPIFQLIYQSPFHLIVNGIFPVSNGLLYADNTALSQSPIPKTDFHLKPIFKYPSSKYLGQLK